MARSPLSQLIRCTPFVMEVIGTSQTGSRGHRSCHISCETCRCKELTAFRYEDVWIAEIAIEYRSLGSKGLRRPKPRKSSKGILPSRQYSPKYSCRMPASKMSMPAGTEVCVVNTLFALQASSAS